MRAIEAVALLLMGGTAMLFAQDIETATNRTALASRYDISDDQIRDLIRRGDVCRVRGVHAWRSISVGITTLEYRPDGGHSERRTCDLCGKTETKEPGTWK